MLDRNEAQALEHLPQGYGFAKVAQEEAGGILIAGDGGQGRLEDQRLADERGSSESQTAGRIHCSVIRTAEAFNEWARRPKFSSRRWRESRSSSGNRGERVARVSEPGRASKRRSRSIHTVSVRQTATDKREDEEMEGGGETLEIQNSTTSPCRPRSHRSAGRHGSRELWCFR